MCFVFEMDSHGFARIGTNLKTKHEVLDCSFEIFGSF